MNFSLISANDMKKPIRVCHLANADVYGGIEEQLKILLNTKKSRLDSKFEYHVILFNRGLLESELSNPGVTVHIVQESRWNFLQQLIKIYRILKDCRIHVVHTHKYKESILGGLAAMLAGIPVKVKTIHGLTEFPSGLAKYRVGFIQKLDMFLSRYICTKIIAVSQEIENKLCEFFNGKLTFITNAVEPDLVEFQLKNDAWFDELTNLKQKYLLIGSIGRLVYVKGYDIFIKAAKLIIKRYPNVRFVLVGDGPEYSKLAKLVEGLGIKDYFFFTGFTQNRLAYLSKFDLFILSSRHEGVPVVLLEAMALKIPILASRVGGIPFIIDHLKNGYMVEPDNPEILANACMTILKNKKLAQSLAENAGTTFCNNFSADIFRNKIHNLYQELFNQNRKGSLWNSKK
jgi:glycosyltransferase involved in cell wall biosynthesis